VPPTAAPASTEPAAPLPAFAADTPLAERLRVLRTRAGLTPPQLIARSGLSKTMVYNLGNGATRSAEAPVLEKLAEALGCPVALLGTPRPPQPPRRAHEVRRDAPAAAATAAEDAPNQMRVAVAATRDADDSQRDVPTPPAGSSPAVVPAHAAGGIPAAAAATLAYAEYRFWIEHIQMPFARVELLVAGAILGVDVEAERDAAAAEALINQANGPTYTLWDESRLGEGRELDDALLQLQNVRDAVDNLTSALTALREADRRLASEEASRA
jgi:transcriptional regulator with XRE-family HTH domain